MKRNLSLDILKLMMSFFIISIHIQPLFEADSLVGWLISNGFARTMVPCFFILNGFFIYNKLDDKKALKKYFIHIITIYLVWSIFYGWMDYFSWASIKLIALRLIGGYHHLWYVSALILGVALLLGVKRVVKKDLYLITIALVLFLIGHILDTSREFPQQYRNGLFLGFPYIAIGYFIRKYNIFDKLSTSYLAIMALVGLVLLLVETYLLHLQTAGTEIHLGALLFCASTIMLGIKKPFNVKINLPIEYFGYLSAGVYFIHPYIMTWFGVLPEHNIVNLLPVFFISIVVSIPIIFFNKRLKIFL